MGFFGPKVLRLGFFGPRKGFFNGLEEDGTFFLLGFNEGLLAGP